MACVHLHFPVLGYRLIRVEKTAPWKHALHEKAYAFFYRAIRGAVHYRKAVIAGTFGLFAAALGTYPFIHQEFFPPSVRPELILDVNLPGGASIRDTKRVMSGIEDHLYGDGRVASFATYIGDSSPRFILLFDPLPPEDGHGQMIITADSTDSRDALKEELSAMIAVDYPEAQAHVRFITTGPPAEYPVMLRLRGPDAAVTASLAKEALTLMKTHPQVANASLNWPETTPIVRLTIDQDKVRTLGIDNYAVSQDLYAKLSGYRIAESYQGISWCRYPSGWRVRRRTIWRACPPCRSMRAAAAMWPSGTSRTLPMTARSPRSGGGMPSRA